MEGTIHPGWAVASVTASGVLTWLLIWVLRRILPMHPPPPNGEAKRLAAEKFRAEVRAALAASDAFREMLETVQRLDSRTSNLVYKVTKYHESVEKMRTELGVHLEETA